MPPLEDETMRQCKAWWYSDQCIRTEDMTKFVNVPDCEEGYPLLKSELPPGDLMQQHPHHPLVYWPVTEPRITLGFLDFMYSKLVRILKTTATKDIVIRQKAVQWCVELLCTPDSRVRFLAAGLLPLVAEIAQTEEDMFLRQELAMCFKYASASTEAWDALVDLKCIDKLVEYFNPCRQFVVDPTLQSANQVGVDNKLLRGNALSALNDCCYSHRARDVLVNKGSTLQFILGRINQEIDRLNTIAALNVLSKCVIGLNYCKKAMEELLNVNAVPTALRLMDSPFLDLKEAATRFLCLICFHIKGKDQAIKQGAIEKLLPYLHHSEPRIQIFGLAALMSITIAVEGKFRIFFARGVPYIKPMLDLTDDVICLYILQLLINTAHHPRARAKLQDCIPILRKMITESTSAWLKRTCRQGIQQLQFTSRPYPNLRFVSMCNGPCQSDTLETLSDKGAGSGGGEGCKIHGQLWWSKSNQVAQWGNW